MDLVIGMVSEIDGEMECLVEDSKLFLEEDGSIPNLLDINPRLNSNHSNVRKHSAWALPNKISTNIVEIWNIRTIP